jgi:spore coat polysaccharide biosynthesis protein SpsF
LVKDQKVVAIIQARMSSSRLPGKVMMDLCGKPLLERVIERVKLAKVIDEMILATSTEPADDVIELHGMANGCSVFRGSLDDVLSRYCEATKMASADIIVRVTADNPLTEPRFIDFGTHHLVSNKLDYVCFENVPYGSDVEVITKKALLKASESTRDKDDREHVTLYIRNSPETFKLGIIPNPFKALARPDVKVTVDTLEDYSKMYKVFWHFRDKKVVQLEEVIRFLDEMSRFPPRKNKNQIAKRSCASTLAN